MADAGDGEVSAGLREWARGWNATEAAVELLIRSFEGRFASADQPWIRHRPGRFWLDTDALALFTGGLSGLEQQVLAVVRALASGQPLAEVASVLAGVDRDNLTLILAAFSHTAGSHEHTQVRRHGDTTSSSSRPGPLVPWPAESPAGVV